MTGRFVVVEGGDGSGKSTQCARLADAVRSRGLDLVATVEPGGSRLGAELRRLLLDGGAVEPRAEALMMAADRAEHVATVVRPALARGAWVVSDRHVPSSLVYQGVVRELGVDAVAALSAFATDDLVPDLVVVLDVDDATADARRASGSDRLEREGRAFHAAVRAAYRDLAARFGWTVVDGSGAPDVVARRLLATVEPLLGS
jgi:dTMP kinase